MMNNQRSDAAAMPLGLVTFHCIASRNRFAKFAS
jgi:hypothetical protein